MLYIISAFLYPGGSHHDSQAPGFSWVHNYWCNLLNERSLNGQHNDGRPVAIAAFAVLGLTLVSFWYIYPKLMRFDKKIRVVIQLSGFVSVTSLGFLSTSLHDTVINIAGFFGLLSTAGIYYSVYKNKWCQLFAFGIINLLLIGVNNYLYYTGDGLNLLPVVQKITFLTCLLWISIIDVRLYLRFGPGKRSLP
jgi:hypothetical protein